MAATQPPNTLRRFYQNPILGVQTASPLRETHQSKLPKSSGHLAYRGSGYPRDPDIPRTGVDPGTGYTRDPSVPGARTYPGSEFARVPGGAGPRVYPRPGYSQLPGARDPGIPGAQVHQGDQSKGVGQASMLQGGGKERSCEKTRQATARRTSDRHESADRSGITRRVVVMLCRCGMGEIETSPLPPRSPRSIFVINLGAALNRQ